MTRVTSLIASLLAGSALAPLQAQTAQPAPPPAATETPQPDSPAPLATETTGPAPTDGAPAAEAEAAGTAEGAAESEEEGEEEEAIVVTGQRPRGSVAGDIQPEVSLSGRQLRAFGAGNLTELLDALAPQTQSGRGRGGERPVILLAGRRISGFREIRDIPPEAIERVDILPEEVALKYGYTADQKVVNIVLRRRFRALTAEAEYGFATQGGRPRFEGDLNLLRIYRNGRWSFDVEYEQQDALFESERNILQSSPSSPFSIGGNIGPAAGASQIDPALSALVGSPVSVAAVPGSAAGGRPTLGSFAAGANNADVTDLGPYRTLLPRTSNLSMNGTWNRTILGNVSATVNATYELANSRSAQGLPSFTFQLPRGNPFSPFGTDTTLYRYHATPRPLGRDSNTETAQLGLAFNGDIMPWRWSVTANYERSFNKTYTALGLDPSGIQSLINAADPTLNPFGTIPDALLVPRPDDQARSTNQSGNVEAVASGPLLRLPGGNISTTVKVGGRFNTLDSDTLRGGVAQSRHLSRQQGNAQVNVDIPIASRRSAFLDAIGDLSANLNAEVNEISDFGTLTTYGGGLNWRPIPLLSLLASFTQEEGAPSTQQLGNPLVTTPNVRVFDFVRGETVDITRLDGGNPALLADNRRVTKLGVNFRPIAEKDLSFTANYTKSRIRNPIASFPTATAEIEAAFPDRFVRDADGRLLRIDARPVNYQRATTEQLRWGFNFSTTLGKAPEPPPGGFRRGPGGRGAGGPSPSEGNQIGSPAQPTTQTSPANAPGGQAGANPRPRGDQGGGFLGGGRRGGGGFGGGRFGGGGARQGRINLSVYHTWQFRNDVLIRPGVPELDFLNGSALGSGGGAPRHQIQAQTAIFKNGFGAFINGNWQSATEVQGGRLGAAAGDLRFSSLATVNLRIFADLGLQPALVRKSPFFRGSRVSIGINNLFASRRNVRDATGATPLSYQPGYLDPLGRSVRVTFRKQFF